MSFGVCKLPSYNSEDRPTGRFEPASVLHCAVLESFAWQYPSEPSFGILASPRNSDDRITKASRSKLHRWNHQLNKMPHLGIGQDASSFSFILDSCQHSSN